MMFLVHKGTPYLKLYMNKCSYNDLSTIEWKCQESMEGTLPR